MNGSSSSTGKPVTDRPPVAGSSSSTGKPVTDRPPLSGSSSSAGKPVTDRPVGSSSSSSARGTTWPNNVAGASSSGGNQGDKIQPTAPTELHIAASLSRAITLSWKPAQDNLAVAYYKIWRNGQLIGYVAASELNYTDQDLQPNTHYHYAVTAGDKAGNESVAAMIESKTLGVSGTVTLTWMEPTERANGEHLYITDIAGYQIRYKLITAKDYIVIDLPAGTTRYSFGDLMGDYIFEISTVDTDGVQSNFVSVPAN